MRIDGQWEPVAGGHHQPTLVVFVRSSTGGWVDCTFLIDTGADNSVLTAELVRELQLPTQPPKHSLGGVGGKAPTVQVKPTFQFVRDDGGRVTLNVECFALTELGALGEPILGRDVLNLFTLVLDPSAEQVCLLHGSHRYIIQET